MLLLTPFTTALQLALLLHSTTASAQTRIITVAPTLPSDEPQWTDDGAFTTAALDTHNVYRADHAVQDLRWNDTLASSSEAYLDSKGSDPDECPPFEHSQSGENLAIGYQNVTQAVEAWGDERDLYDFGHQGFSKETGHFTQVVWQNTTDLGCARKFCLVDGREYEGWYLVCHYWPVGNVQGQYDEQVHVGDYNPNGGATLGAGLTGVLFTAACLAAWLSL